MKLNFWQWLAVVLLVIGIAWWVFDSNKAAKQNAPSGNAGTHPTTAP
jgi:hypothetical protein